MTAPDEPAAVDEPEREGLTPIVPPQTIAGRALTLVIAIMTFLAGLTIGTVTLVDRAAESWQSDIGREVTIEIRPIGSAPLDEEIAKAVALAQEFPGVASARAVTDEETRRLLEPWLGAGVDLSALPVPRLVIVSIDDPAAFSVLDLAAAVQKDIRGGSVDDHAAWVDRLRAMAQSMVAVGLAILALMLVAMVLSVVFATRAAMAGNRQIIEVLHFCGAEDRFIAGEFQHHFLILGVRGGAVGGGLAILAFLIAGWFLNGATGRPGADQFDMLFGGVDIGWSGYIFILILITAVAILTAITSRFAVHRSLQALE